jgi:hypothetical protein
MDLRREVSLLTLIKSVSLNSVEAREKTNETARAGLSLNSFRLQAYAYTDE